jgi:hypothetical protein
MRVSRSALLKQQQQQQQQQRPVSGGWATTGEGGGGAVAQAYISVRVLRWQWFSDPAAETTAQFIAASIPSSWMRSQT